MNNKQHSTDTSYTRKCLLAAGLTLMITSSTAWAQTEVTVGVMRGKEYGVTYMLPRTEIEILLQVTRHHYTPGEYMKYAEQYLHLGNVKPQENLTYSLDKVTMRPIGVPDKEHTYFVRLRDKSTAPLMELTEEGIVRSINMPFSGTPKADSPATTQPIDPATQPLDPRSLMTEEMLMANSNAKRAELVAKEIYDIRDSRNALLRGEADNMPKDGTQLKLMLDNLNRQEQALTELFTGHVEQQTQLIPLRIELKESTSQVAFRFSRLLGLLDSQNLAGEPYTLVVTNLTPELGAPLTPEEEKKQLDGVAYNVPGRARVQLIHGGQMLYDKELPVAQFGSKEYLAPVLFNKNATTKVLFDVNTGAILKVDRSE